MLGCLVLKKKKKRRNNKDRRAADPAWVEPTSCPCIKCPQAATSQSKQLEYMSRKSCGGRECDLPLSDFIPYILLRGKMLSICILLPCQLPLKGGHPSCCISGNDCIFIALVRMPAPCDLENMKADSIAY